MRGRSLSSIAICLLLLAPACERAADSPTGPVSAVPRLATGVTVACSTIPAGYVILGQTNSRNCPNPNLRFNAWTVGIPGASEFVCRSSPIPTGYVHAANPTLAACPGSLGMMIVAARLREDVCAATSPIPVGYVRTRTSQSSTGTCKDGRYAEIKLPGPVELVCSDSPVPANYRVYRVGIAGNCAPLKSDWIVRTSGTSPVGLLEHITPINQFVNGWVCQPDHPGRITDVHLYAGGPWPAGKMFAAVRPTHAFSAQPYDAVCGPRAVVSFSPQLSAAQKATLGPGVHVVYAHAIDSDGGPHPVLGPSRLLRIPPHGSATPPIGHLIGITADGVVYGWACQPDHPELATEIHLYAGAPFPAGRAFAAIRTGLFAPWPSTERTCSMPGFRHRLTAAQLAHVGRGTHAVYAHVIDSDGGPHPLLPPSHPLVVR